MGRAWITRSSYGRGAERKRVERLGGWAGGRSGARAGRGVSPQKVPPPATQGVSPPRVPPHPRHRGCHHQGSPPPGDTGRVGIGGVSPVPTRPPFQIAIHSQIPNPKSPILTRDVLYVGLPAPPRHTPRRPWTIVTIDIIYTCTESCVYSPRRARDITPDIYNKGGAAKRTRVFCNTLGMRR